MKAKKIILALAVCLACSGVLFAQESESTESKNPGSSIPIRLEAEAALVGLDVKGSYMFPINDVLRWDVGLNVNVLHDYYALMGAVHDWNKSTVERYGKWSFNILATGSFWFWNFYTSYGLGVGINTAGGAAFIPFDLRIGWEPGALENKRISFKLEAGLHGTTHGDGIYKNDYPEEENYGGWYYKIGDRISSTVQYTILPTLGAGIAIRL